jgi:DUF4097 and DUF4098 domain-containing protein YvlB
MADDLIREERQFSLGQITEAEVELEVASGLLRVGGGSGEFGDARFEYSHPELQPEVEFSVDGSKANLEIRQPKVHGLSNARYCVDLSLNSQAAIELGVASASGNVELDLDHVNLTSLDVEAASGNVEASLAGRYEVLEQVVLDIASGRVEARLSGNFPKLETVEAGSASGRTRIDLTGACPALRRVEVGSASGNIELDLRGNFARDDLGVRIQAASGNITVMVPSDIGVSLSARKVSGNVRADGFNHVDGRLANQAFGTSTATIWLNIQVASGNINVVTG